MKTDQFEIQQEFKDIIYRIQHMVSVTPSDDFTESVMTRIPLPENETFHSFLSRNLGAREPSSAAFYFITAAYFYFIMGIVLFVLVPRLRFGNEIMFFQWVIMQSQIIFIAVISFTLSGIFLLKKHIAAVSTAYFGTLIYIGFVAINGIHAYKTSKMISFGMSGSLSLITGELLIGIFLFLMLEKHQKHLRINT